MCGDSRYHAMRYKMVWPGGAGLNVSLPTILKTTLASLLLLTVYGRGVTLELMSHVIAGQQLDISLTQWARVKRVDSLREQQSCMYVHG